MRIYSKNHSVAIAFVHCA